MPRGSCQISVTMSTEYVPPIKADMGLSSTVILTINTTRGVYLCACPNCAYKRAEEMYMNGELYYDSDVVSRAIIEFIDLKITTMQLRYKYHWL